MVANRERLKMEKSGEKMHKLRRLNQDGPERPGQAPLKGLVSSDQPHPTKSPRPHRPHPFAMHVLGLPLLKHVSVCRIGEAFAPRYLRPTFVLPQSHATAVDVGDCATEGQIKVSGVHRVVGRSCNPCHVFFVMARSG